MALFNIIKCDVEKNLLIWKHPTEDIKLGSQLIVRPGQVAVFCRNGELYDLFDEGTYTLHTGNIPLLNKLINLPFGGKTPFQAEVWFINKLTILDNKWGTQKPLMLKDPEYKLVIPLRAFGQYGFHVIDPKLFMFKIFGTLKTLFTRDIIEYFCGIVLTQVVNNISSLVIANNITLLELPVHLVDLSDSLTKKLNTAFSDYGLEIVNFSIISINFPEDDSSLLALKKATEKKMHIETVGIEVYTYDRGMDVLNTAASNEGSSGDLMGAALGLGLGAGIGPILGKQILGLDSSINKQSDPIHPPANPKTIKELYYFYIEGKQYGPYEIDTVAEYIKQGIITSSTIAWKKGLSEWVKTNQIPELLAILDSGDSPPLPPPDIKK